MDAKVKEFLDAAKTKERKAFEKERDEHLISLGLIKEEKKEYSDFYSWQYPFYDDNEKKYFSKVSIPIEVSDEDYDEIKKLSPPKPTIVEEDSIDNGAEQFLGVINVISLIIGIIAAAALVLVAMNSYRDGGYYVLAGVIILLISLVSWAVVKVILNISNNLHEINRKLK